MVINDWIARAGWCLVTIVTGLARSELGRDWAVSSINKSMIMIERVQTSIYKEKIIWNSGIPLTAQKKTSKS